MGIIREVTYYRGDLLERMGLLQWDLVERGHTWGRVIREEGLLNRWVYERGGLVGKIAMLESQAY